MSALLGVACLGCSRRAWTITDADVPRWDRSTATITCEHCGWSGRLNVTLTAIDREVRRLPPAPWADLARWVTVHHDGKRWAADEPDPYLRQTMDLINDTYAAELFGCTPRSISRWRANGQVPADTLEAIADRLGVHPSELWPGYVDALIEAAA